MHKEGNNFNWHTIKYGEPVAVSITAALSMVLLVMGMSRLFSRFFFSFSSFFVVDVLFYSDMFLLIFGISSEIMSSNFALIKCIVKLCINSNHLKMSDKQITKQIFQSNHKTNFVNFKIANIQ